MKYVSSGNVAVLAREKDRKRLGPCQRAEKAVGPVDDGDPNRNWYAKNSALEQWLEELEIRGRTGTIQTTALLRSARTHRRIL